MSTALQQIRDLARSATGKYYVHCGLGRDRVNVVKHMLEREGTNVREGEGFARAETFRDRLTNGLGAYERGPISELGTDIWLIPYPNEHELFGNMLSGQVRHVLLLLDAGDSQQRRFKQFGVPFSIDTLQPGDRTHAAELCAKARTLPRPLAIVVSYTPPKGPAGVATTLVNAFHATASADLSR
jgi:hypothetical protein